MPVSTGMTNCYGVFLQHNEGVRMPVALAVIPANAGIQESFD